MLEHGRRCKSPQVLRTGQAHIFLEILCFTDLMSNLHLAFFGHIVEFSLTGAQVSCQSIADDSIWPKGTFIQGWQSLMGNFHRASRV